MIMPNDLAGYQVYFAQFAVAAVDANKSWVKQSQYLDTGLGIDTAYFMW